MEISAGQALLNDNVANSSQQANIVDAVCDVIASEQDDTILSLGKN
jgi:hypothetical protein